MKVEIVETQSITTYVGVRAVERMAKLGPKVEQAFKELADRRNEIANIKSPGTTFGITPPNYKGNDAALDFYCCYEVEPLTRLPHGMVHIHLLPRTYSVTHFRGPISRKGSAYDVTSKWLKENGYVYDDVSYYFEVYDEKTHLFSDDEESEVKIYCPVRR